jgi:hypothetical protein
MAAKKGNKSERYEPIPYASEQGIFCGLAGNFKSAIREIAALIRESELRWCQQRYLLTQQFLY